MSAALLHLNESAFDGHTLKAHAGPVVVDFWAEWCGPCKALAPVLDDLAKEYAGRVTIAKVNVDEHPELAARFQVRSIPTLMIFKGGERVGDIIGAVPKAKIKEKLDAVA